MGKILGIDFGLKRTGLSITDDLNVFAFGLDTVDSKNLIVFLRELMLKENIDKIVLGLPKGLNNEDTNITIELEYNDIDETPNTQHIYSIVNQPQYSSIFYINHNIVYYKPQKNFHGTDHFAYQVNDGGLISNIGIINLTIKFAAFLIT